MLLRLCLVPIVFCSGSVVDLVMPFRYYVTVGPIIKCDANLSTTISIQDSDTLFNDILAFKHVSKPGFVTLQAFEKEFGRFEPYIELVGECKGRKHRIRQAVPQGYVYDRTRVENLIFKPTFDLN
ncbi:unnamed protein product [Bursaphelenchus xylophilus]|uniref:(pine wood nematode) hypothetical protein n=1 Tax=Bursaphelenchus xylophilus TaxID=6326 RepID=A0A1I7RQG9_BURXY|nr:unnamed protein product [Bursaphelenchus xylophilus]CAG9104559.1 unnamed protein product [Bursaphelenchus xylophilus]